MALSGKTTNFELKYPAVSDSIVMGPGPNQNDFKEMMDSVDAAFQTSGITDLGLIPGDLQQDEGAILLDITGQGIYKYRVASGGEEEEEYLINVYNMWVQATTQFRFTYNSMYMRLLDFTNSGSGQSVPWTKFATEDITGDLADLTTTADSDLVSAINEIAGRSGITDLGTLADKGNALLDITDTGIYKFNVKAADNLTNEYILIVTKETYKTIYEETVTIMQILIDGLTVTYSGDVPGYNIKIRQFKPVEGISNISWINLPMGIADNLTTQNTYEALSAAQGYALKGLVDALDERVTEIEDGSSGSKKYSTIVIGNSASGLTANDVDYLYTADSDFSATLTNAINALPSTGGEIKILSGTYTFNSNCQIFGSSDKPIKITGEGSCTKFTGTSSCLLNYCEISNIQLNNTLTINSEGGYVTIHDCEFNLDEITGIEMSGLGKNVSRIIIKNNLLNMLSPGSSDFIKLTGTGGVFNLEIIGNHIHDNGGYGGDIQFINCIDKHIEDCYIMNNDIGRGFINMNMHIDEYEYHNKIFGNIIGGITISAGSYWEIENNSIGQINIHSGHNNGKIINNMINSVSSIGLSTNSTFVGNVILQTNFDVAKIPGYNNASNKWGNNMWADGIDRLIFANGEGIGEGQGDI